MLKGEESVFNEVLLLKKLTEGTTLKFVNISTEDDVGSFDRKIKIQAIIYDRLLLNL